MGLRPLLIYFLLQWRYQLKSSESDVYRRQILTSKVDPRAVRVKTIIHEPKNHNMTKRYVVNWY